MIAYSWDAVVKHVARRLSDASGETVTEADLVKPPKSELGDLAYGCFALAKKAGKNPAEIAKELAAKFSDKDPTIESMTAAGPYVNVILRAGDLIARVVKDVENYGVEYGTSDDGKGKSLMLEYAQPNTHKEIHVGHLRNLVLGSSLAKLLHFDGWKVVTASYHGDVGAHVSKCLWLFVRKHASAVPQPKPKKVKKGELEQKPLDADAWTSFVLESFDDSMADALLGSISKSERTGEYLGRLYAEANALVEENPDFKPAVSEVQRKLEAHASGWTKLWQETRRWSITEMGQVFQELGVSIDRQYFESEVVDNGQKIVDGLLKKNVAKMSEGAVIIPLEEEKLGVFLIRKSDGTSLYATKDLALDGLKMAEYPQINRSLILVDNRQTLYFKQLFRTLELMGSKTPHEFIGYEFVTLKSGAMSSREGSVVTWGSFRDEVLKFAAAETQKRHDDWPKGRIEHTAWCLAMGGIKFGMLKQDGDKIFTFDLEKSLSFEGDTGPYIQYAATRLMSILKKAGWRPEMGTMVDISCLHERAEKQLVLQIANYPEVCRRAAAELRPAILAQWCFVMAQRVSDFYHEVNVLESPFGIKQARLQLVSVAHSVLVLGLDVLGIPVPEEM